MSVKEKMTRGGFHCEKIETSSTNGEKKVGMDVCRSNAGRRKSWKTKDRKSEVERITQEDKDQTERGGKKEANEWRADGVHSSAPVDDGSGAAGGQGNGMNERKDLQRILILSGGEDKGVCGVTDSKNQADESVFSRHQRIR